MTHIVKGSLSAIAQAANSSLAEAFMHADTVILVDTSGSMEDRDGTHQTRYDRACTELRRLQANLEGRIAVISFSTAAEFCPGGVPTFQRGGTMIGRALEFIHIADGCVDRFILISDGEPQDETEAMAWARQFTTKIDTLFIGDESAAYGPAFLKRLAAASGGTSATIKTAQLSERIERLMLVGA